MIDARIAVTLPGHPKTKKLIRRLGDGAAWKLICLFLWAASNRPNGDLSGLADDNLVAACVPCNRSKGAKTPEQWRGE